MVSSSGYNTEMPVRCEDHGRFSVFSSLILDLENFVNSRNADVADLSILVRVEGTTFCLFYIIFSLKCKQELYKNMIEFYNFIIC